MTEPAALPAAPSPAAPADPGAFKRHFARCLAEHGRFSHAAHLHLAWLLLEEGPALAALAQFDAGLRALADASGQPEKYNATLTTAYFFLLLERRQAGQSWETFAEQHADLLDWEQRQNFLGAFYDEDTLRSEAARRHFLMPRCPDAGP
ncbi:hypothetical protein DKM44_09620 [Deinococcus irradiatisoli]|uniref:Uncharacterized protein n=1 Tax=Deinococcus irradiatisoli TaxID=2202254 RepID=A0A2Z3JEI4_9DEIO|nr:hypothetical protein [Deinococcus irradiatisoli]AWN23452.1 hypothetical protein DKM44_09620 [Deinococcus irradiatisoli]